MDLLIELLKISVPIMVALVSSGFVYISSRNKIKAEIDSLEKIQKSEIQRLEKEQKHELDKLHEEVQAQSKLYENQSQTDLTNELVSDLFKSSSEMPGFFDEIMKSEINKAMKEEKNKK